MAGSAITPTTRESRTDLYNETCTEASERKDLNCCQVHVNSDSIRSLAHFSDFLALSCSFASRTVVTGMNATGGVQITPHRTHTRALFLVAHACARQMWSHVWIKGLTICLCVCPKVISPQVMSLLNVPSTLFPPIFSSPTASLKPPAASPTLSTGIRPNPCVEMERLVIWPNRSQTQNPSSWHWSRKNSKHWHKLEATRCNSQRTRDDDSEGFRTSSTCQNGGECAIPHHQWICYGRKQFFSFMQRRSRTEKFSKNEITGSSHRWCQDWTSDWNRSIQICRNVGVWSATTVTTTRIWEVLGANFMRNRTLRTTMYSNTDWPQTSCGRAITTVTELRATASTGNQWQFDSQIQSCAKAKAHINWFQSTSLDNDASNSVNEKRLRILRTRLQAPRKESTSWRLSWSWRIMSWRTWQVLSKLSIETKKSGLLHLVVLLTNPEWSIVMITTGTIIYIRAVQGHSHGARINRTLFLWKR